MIQDNEPVTDARTAQEREIIKTVERWKRRKMTEKRDQPVAGASARAGQLCVVRRRADPRAREHRCSS